MIPPAGRKEFDDEILLLISEKIKEMRKSKGYKSYETFALDNDLDRKQYWRLENGSNMTLRSLIKILKIHNVSLKKFFTDLKLEK